MNVTAIIAAGGFGRRLGAAVPKQLLDLDGRSMLERSVSAFVSHPRVRDVVVALPADILSGPPAWLTASAPRLRLVAGGERRQDSVANAFDAIAGDVDVVLIHDAARPFVTADVISRSIDAAAEHGAAIAAMPAHDTVKRVEGAIITETLPRESIYLAQTPQAFRRGVLQDAVMLGRSGVSGTDEAALAEQAGHKVHVIEGDVANVKITTAADLELARATASSGHPGTRAIGPSGPRAPGQAAFFVGVGYDLHRLVVGRPLILGGVNVPSNLGALGHSDADVICHAVTDAILGAARAGDIGRLFPDTDPTWKDASSVALLKDAVALVRGRGFTVQNVDVVVIVERPKIAPHREAIESRLAEALGVDAARVSVKAKTNEGMDAIGRGEAIAAHAAALLTMSDGSRTAPTVNDAG
jgi:2-C-methyl-D-erythritol 4-phosphate cytidylyltransferase/2-C-methyl-D-erythritol 2,4-cyclodiphosphate synthase